LLKLSRLCIAAVAIVLGGCANHAAGAPASQMIPPMTVPAAAPPAQPVDVVVGLPLRNADAFEKLLAQITDPASPQFQHFITRDAFAAEFAPSASDLGSVAREMRSAGFDVSIGSQAVFGYGNARQAAAYFRTSIGSARFVNRFGKSESLALATKPIRLSPLLASLHATVIGLDGIRPAQTLSYGAPAANRKPDDRTSPYGPYVTPELRQAYRFPSSQVTNGANVTMAVVIDSPIHLEDSNYYASRELAQKSLNVVTQTIHGGAKWEPNGSSFEAMLDVEQEGGIAPGGKIVVIDVPNLGNAYIYQAYDAAFKNKDVAVVNSSFGLCEADYDSAAGRAVLKQTDQLFESGSAVGTTWVAASGDRGNANCPDDSWTQQGLVWPGSDPNVLSVGGTNLTTRHSSSSNDSSYVSENDFPDLYSNGAHWGSGGGYSALYARPSWQTGLNTQKGRGVPDLALEMGGLSFSILKCEVVTCQPNDSSDWERLAGKWIEVAGTSEASPDIVGLIALRIALQHKNQGDIHRWLYAQRGLFRESIHGNNGFKAPGTGRWNPVFGLGTPYGNAFAGSTSVAGTPGTSSNPGR
jgi:subtilase family serine protease